MSRQILTAAFLSAAVFSMGSLESTTAAEYKLDETGGTTAYNSVGELITYLKVDLVMPNCDYNCLEALPGTGKAGWWHWAAPRWFDMYGHDAVWERGETSLSSTDPNGIDGTGVHARISTTYDGQTGLKTAGLAMCSLNSENCGSDPDWSGSVLYEPICNTWLQQIDWPEFYWGTIILSFHGLPAGEYYLYSYHNNFECKRGDDNRPECSSIENPQPNMPSITAMALIDAGGLWPNEGHYIWRNVQDSTDPALLLGTGDVELLEGAYDVPVQQVTTDAQLNASVIRFSTDGSAVLVIYENGCCVADGVRPSRSGGRAILNAFELKTTAPSPKAYLPTPGDGDKGVERSAVLGFRAGAEAESHDIYFGTSRSAVLAADKDSPEYMGNYPLGTETYNPGNLLLETTYYWRVDEVGAAGTVTGDLWSFTTSACLSVDDFEAPPEQGDVWAGLGGGAVYRVCTCGTNTYQQGEAMPSTCEGEPIPSTCGLNHIKVNEALTLEYINLAFGSSEAGLTFQYPQDWTGDPEYLAVFVKGRASGNINDRMYMVIEDALGGTAEAAYDGPANLLTTNEWQPWAARLDAFGGVDLSQVKAVYLGVGRRGAGPSMAYGTVYFDDLGICVPGCWDRLEKAPKDYNADCIINFKDHAVEPAVTSGSMLQYRDFAAAWLEDTLWP